MKKFIVIFSILTFLLLPIVSFAEGTGTDSEGTGSDAEATGHDITPIAGSNTPLDNPITGSASETSIPGFIEGIISVALGLTGVLALTAFIYGGLLWMVSMGNSSLVEKGKNVMIWATVGLLLVFGSYAIMSQIFKLLGY